jgi:molybdopterin-guanine dinucleotide biosynthesis adapter protein
MMRVIGFVGWSGSGKTTLIVRLIPELIRRGLSVSTLKHAHHRFDIDRPGKDSHEHRMAGAVEVLISSSHRWALMHESRGEPEPSVEELLARMSPVDLVVIEGFKRHPHPKIEVWRGEEDSRPLWLDDPEVIAVATDRPLPAAWRDQRPIRVLALDDVSAVADFVLEHRGSAPIGEK